MGIGPVFGDFVTEEKVRRSRNHFRGGSGLFSLVPHVLLFLVLAFIFVRLFNLQVVHGEYYRRLSDENRMKTDIIHAPRGIIFDRDGKPLVSNSPAFKLVEGDEVRWVSREEALALESIGATVSADVQRTYSYSDTFSHVLGYIGQISQEELLSDNFSGYVLSDFVGKSGLELEYEHILHGVNGKKLYEVDSSGEVVRLLGEQDPVPGKNITTTLDLDIQLSVQDAMEDVERGAVVVSSVENGGILALYSKPSFDPNVFTHNESYEAEGEYRRVEDVLTGAEQPLLNRAIGGTYAPGSTYKLVSATAALESGAVTPDTEIEDTGIHRVGDFSFGNWYFLEQGGTDGMVNMVKGIARSNDIYFYIASERTGIDAIALWSKTFGLGRLSGIDLPGESRGVVPGPSWKERNIGEQWYVGDTYNLGIGQGYLLATPLQVNTWASVFASDGRLMRPHLLEGNDELLREDFVKRETIDVVREGMRQSCEDGGVAFPFFNFAVENSRLSVDDLDYVEASSSASSDTVEVKVGCKTGTSETPGEDTDPHAWITVFAPYHNPEVVITVLVENGGQGSEVAGPIARDVLRDYFEDKED